MSPKTHLYPLLIVEGHLDTFGHVNNAKYLELFEEARWALITEGGFGLARIRELRQGPVILEAQVKFRREVKNRERVVIETSLEKYEGKIGSLLQRLLKEDGTLACEARFAIALWDIDARKLLPPTEEWRRAIGLAAQ